MCAAADVTGELVSILEQLLSDVRKTLAEYLEKLRAAKGLQSDYGLAARRHLQGGSAARVYAQS